MHISIVTAESLQLEALLETLAELEEPPIVDLVAVSHDSQSALYAGRSLAFEVLEDYDFSVCDYTLLLTDSVAVAAAASLLKSEKCEVIAWQSSASELVDIAPERLTLVADPYVQALAQMLSHLPDALYVEQFSMTAFLPSSLFAKEGVAELASQTAKLLNAQTIENGVFGTQMTFNYFPLSSTIIGKQFEIDLLAEVKGLFKDANVHLNAVQMPVFHGYGAQVNFEFSAELPSSEFLELMQAAEFIEVASESEGVSGLSFANSLGNVLLGNVQQSESDLDMLSCWFGFDEAKFGVANNWISAIMKG